MASTEEAVKELEDQLTCAVCLQLYNNPKDLSCHHVFCTVCLGKCRGKNDRGDPVVVCPSCREHTPLTAGGVADLPSSFRTNQLFDVRHRLLSKTAPKEAKKGCPDHDGKPLELWCEPCEELICFHCSLEDENHHNHKYKLLTKAHQQASEAIKAAIAPLEEHKGKVEVALSDAKDNLDRLEHERVAAMEAIIASTDRLQDMVAEFKRSTLKKLDSMVEEKTTSITPHKAQLETSIIQLDNCIMSVKKKLEENSPESLVNRKKGLCLKAAQLTQELKPDALHRPREGSIKFKYNDESLRDAIQNSFLLFFSNVSPRRCRVTGQGLGRACVGKRSTVSLDLLTDEGEPIKVEVKDVCCELVSDIMGKSVEVSTVRMKPSKMEFSFVPLKKGRHLLSVKVEAEHVQGSPCSVLVESSSNDYDQPMSIICTTPNPLATLVLEDGRIVVTSVVTKAITLYDQRGNLLCQHDKNYYTSFAHKRGTSVFAVDRDRAVFELDLDSPSSASLLVSAPQFSYIGDIAFDSSSNTLFLLYYDLIDSDKPKYVEAMCLTSKEKIQFGEQGSRNGQLLSPKGLTVETKTGRVFIADTNNHRVQVFTKGKYSFKFGKEGTSSGCLTLPSAVALHLDQVFVGDAANCVSVFTTKGQYLFNVGASCGVDDIESLFVDRSGVLYICDRNKSRLLLF